MDLTILQHPFHLTVAQYYLLLFGSCAVGALALSYGILRALELYVSKSFPEIKDEINVHELFSPWLAIFISIVVLAKTSQNLLPGTRFEFLIQALRIMTFFGGVMVASRSLPLLKAMAQKFFNHGTTSDFRQREISTQFQFVEKIFRITLWAAAFVATLCSFNEGRDFAKSLIASAGILGVLIGFAAQKSLGNLMAGFQIAFTQPIRLDDVVVVENQWGRVEKITLSYVVICLWDLRRLVVPINYFIDKPFENWTKTSRNLLPFTLFYLDYSFPVDALRKEFERVIQESPHWDKKLAIMQVTDSTEKTMTVRALMSAQNASSAFDLRCFIRERLIAFIQVNYPDAFPKTRISGDEVSVAQHLLSRNLTQSKGDHNDYAKTGN